MHRWFYIGIWQCVAAYRPTQVSDFISNSLCNGTVWNILENGVCVCDLMLFSLVTGGSNNYWLPAVFVFNVNIWSVSPVRRKYKYLIPVI